jgi:glycosyltransferase involved in cell wall biosynthesis
MIDKENIIPKVSVLVPIYNVEKYLRQCLDSIVRQTLSDLEIILINDGSKDNSLAIMKEYAEKDKRIKIIDKLNEGYGKTMNRGLDMATGEYIGIVESDDWIELDMYEILYTLAKENDVDVVKSDHFDYIDEKSTQANLFEGQQQLLNRVVCARDEFSIFYIRPTIWTAIYKRNFINEKKIRFLESPGASYQDTSFNFKVWAMANRVWLTPKAFLHYRRHTSQSVVATGKVFCVQNEWREIERFMADYPEWEKSSRKLRNRLKFNGYNWNLNRLKGANKEAFGKVFCEEYKEHIEKGEFELSSSFFPKKDLLKFLIILNPNDFCLKLQKIILDIGRLFLRIRKKNGKLGWYILCGSIYIPLPAPSEKRPAFLPLKEER